MANDPLSDLLQPTVGRAPPQQVPYSLQAALLTSFFGGPFAALAIFGINAKRIGRLRSQAPLIAALGVVHVASQWWLHTVPSGAAFGAWLASVLAMSRAPRLLSGVFGLVVFVVCAFVHRREHKASELVGKGQPNGLKIGVALIVGGRVANAFLTGVLT